MKKFLNLKSLKPGNSILAALPVLYLEGLQLLQGESFSFTRLFISIFFAICIFLSAGWLQYQPPLPGYGKYNLAWLILGTIWLVSTAVTVITESQIMAWIGIAAYLALSLGVIDITGGQSFSLRWWLLSILVGGSTVLVLVLFNQVLLRFSEEEFFSALQAGFLFVFWILLAVAHTAQRELFIFPSGRWLQIKNIYLILFFIFLTGLAGMGVVRRYQSSFYTTDVKSYPGISANNPFLCGTADSPDKPEVIKTYFQDYIQAVASNSQLDPPDEGLLFVATGDLKWAKVFHDGLLREAGLNLFTGPANSVKFDQYLAALRVYAYVQVKAKQADLFTAEEQTRIENWFHAINRRAMTVEWVDWLYGMAFSYYPQGPYENQENGAGLIALLEAENLADPGLSQQNQDYLARNLRGWAARFHNTDDSIFYQSEWITNAYFQQIYSGKASLENIHNAFEWMLLQMLPDGRAPQYNLPSGYSLANALYLGAILAKDDQYLWLAEKALAAAKETQTPLNFQPGTEKPLDFSVAAAPRMGSCLLYGDSGLPNQIGPLAPDKIVFRDGWSSTDTYLLLNLRFTGWHRYKGTNTITLIDKGGPLVSEEITSQDFSWLPKGRSTFRDKRIPRQNLNGLQVKRTGIDAVLYQLLGTGGPWAQDPPYYAQVDQFSTSSEMDVSQTSLVDWHGWTQTRKIYFSHNGITVIYDVANGPITQSSAVAWNIMGNQKAPDGRFLLGNNNSKAEMIFFNQEGGALKFSPNNDPGNPGASQILYQSPANGHLQLVTVLLTGNWIGSQVQLTGANGNGHLEVKGAGNTFQLELSLSGR
jgi:hypothetical protein